MNRFSIKCPSCGRPVPADRYNASDLKPCDNCTQKIRVTAFPALYRRETVLQASTAAALDEAACFYHVDKQADAVCDDCGRFLCGLCSLPFGEETLCSSCLELRRKGEGLHALKAREMRHDKLAVLLTLGAFLMALPFWWFPVIPCGMALAALYVAVRYWKRRPAFHAGRYRVRLVCCSIFSIGIAVGSVLGSMAIFRSLFHG